MSADPPRSLYTILTGQPSNELPWWISTLEQLTLSMMESTILDTAQYGRKLWLAAVTDEICRLLGERYRSTMPDVYLALSRVGAIRLTRADMPIDLYPDADLAARSEIWDTDRVSFHFLEMT